MSEQDPSHYEKDTRIMIEKLDKQVNDLDVKVTREFDKLESKINTSLDNIFNKIEQTHEKNSNRLYLLQEGINQNLKDFSDKNEEFKNATAGSIKEVVEKYSNRPPLWSSFLITGLFGLLTATITAIVNLLK